MRRISRATAEERASAQFALQDGALAVASASTLSRLFVNLMDRSEHQTSASHRVARASMSVLPISTVSPLVCGRPPPVHGGDHVFDDRQQHPEARAQPRIHDRLGKAAHGCRSRHILFISRRPEAVLRSARRYRRIPPCRSGSPSARWARPTMSANRGARDRRHEWSVTLGKRTANSS